MLRFLSRVMGPAALTLVLASSPHAAFAEPNDVHQHIAQQSSEATAPKSEAAEAWDAVKDTTNPALLDAFIQRYGTTFFAELARARLEELKTAAARPRGPAIGAMPMDGVRERVALYEEDPADSNGKRFDGSVIWRTETIRASGKPDELAARADIEIPSRGLRVKMSLRRNLDPTLPATHTIDLAISSSSDFDAGGIANVPGVLMKANERARGTPLAGLSVKVAEGFFLVGLSAVDTDRERNLKLLLERAWFDIPTVYANQKRAIVAIEKGESGQNVFATVFKAWGQYPASGVVPDESDYTMPEEWKRTMTGRPKAQ